MPEGKFSDSGRGSKSSSLNRRELYDCKITIHGRFYLKSNETLVASEAYSYIHMNKEERMRRQAVSEKAVFKFYDEYLRVCKPNVLSSVKESKYPYSNIDKYFVFEDYPGIVVFCIIMPTYRMAFLFECSSIEVAEKACNMVEEHKKKRSLDDGHYSDDSSEPSYEDRGAPVVMRGGAFEGGSSIDSHSRDEGPGILKSRSFERRPISKDDDDDQPVRRKPLGVLHSGNFDGRSPKAARPVSAGPGILEGGSFDRSPPYSDKRRPMSQIYSQGPSRPLLNVAYDRSPQIVPRSLKDAPPSPRPLSHGKGFHKRGQRLAAYNVSILGRYRMNNPREDLGLEGARSYLSVGLSNPPGAHDKGELHLYSDRMKLAAMSPGHYDYNQIHRIYCFDNDPSVLIFGIEEKNKYFYMLVRFQSLDQLNEAFRTVNSKGENKEIVDYRLSEIPRGNTYSVNGSSTIDQMSKTITLPSEREVEAKRIYRQSHSSSMDSKSEVEEETVVGIRRSGVQAAPSLLTQKDYDAEFSLLMSRMHNEHGKNTKYMNSEVIDEVNANRTTGSVMYLDEEETKRSNIHRERQEDVIKASTSSQSYSVIKEVAAKPPNLDPQHRRGSTQWVVESAYIDYKPERGNYESDVGPVYMYCAREIRKDNYRL